MNSPFQCGPNPCQWICRPVVRPNCGCFGPSPETIPVTIDWSNNEFPTIGSCTNCDTADGTYLTTPDPNVRCQWITTFPFTCQTSVGDIPATWSVFISSGPLDPFPNHQEYIWNAYFLADTVNNDDALFRRRSLIRDCSKEFKIPLNYIFNANQDCYKGDFVIFEAGATDPAAECSTGCSPTTPATITATLTGLADNSCSCSALNNIPLICNRISACVWRHESTFNCGGTQRWYMLEIQRQQRPDDPSLFDWLIMLATRGQAIYWYKQTSQADCTQTEICDWYATDGTFTNCSIPDTSLCKCQLN